MANAAYTGTRIHVGHIWHAVYMCMYNYVDVYAIMHIGMHSSARVCSLCYVLVFICMYACQFHGFMSVSLRIFI